MMTIIVDNMMHMIHLRRACQTHSGSEATYSLLRCQVGRTSTSMQISSIKKQTYLFKYIFTKHREHGANIFAFKIYQAARNEPPSGPVLAHGPRVWHT